MKTFIIRYGILGASISIVLGLLNWFFIAPAYGPNISEAIGYLSIVMSLLTIPLGIKYFRDQLNQGMVSIKEGFKIGTGITLIASVIMGLYGMLFFMIEGDNFTAWHEQWASQIDMRQVNVSDMPDYMLSPLFQGVVMFIMVFLIGIIINLVSVLILKRAGKPVVN